MKNIKKTIAVVMALATLGCVSAMPTYAVTFKDNGTETEKTLEYYQKNSIREAFLVLTHGDSQGTYYFNSYYVETGKSAVDLSDLTPEELQSFEQGSPIKVSDDVDTTGVTVITRDDDNYWKPISIELPNYFTTLYWSDPLNMWLVLEGGVNKATLGESSTVGDSTTVGESEPTGVRGDINYDGKVTPVDLLLLKKYLLGIVKW